MRKDIEQLFGELDTLQMYYHQFADRPFTEVNAIIAKVKNYLTVLDAVMAHHCVVQEWVHTMPLRMQSVLLLGTRGPDTHRVPEVKKLTRWIRSLAFVPGNPENVVQFMLIDGMPPRIEEKSKIARELEFVSQHYYSHLMHALEVIGYRYPIGNVAMYAYHLYYDMCKLFHLPMEERATFEERLRQMEWPEGKQPKDGLEAFNLIEKHNMFSDMDRQVLDKMKEI